MDHLSLVDRISAVLSQCMNLEENDQELDNIILQLRLSLAEIGELLDRVLLTNELHLESSIVQQLQELQSCLNQLCVQYETRVLLCQSDRTTPGRPKKIVNLQW